VYEILKGEAGEGENEITNSIDIFALRMVFFGY
jgi:hypothetical protein